MAALESAIATHPFTKDLDPRYLDLLAVCATFERFAPQQQIFQETFESDKFYLILSGQVVLQTFVPNRGIVNIETIQGGSVLGWSWLFPPHHWHFGAVATEPTEVVAFDAKALRKKMEADHDFGYAISMRMSAVILERLQATRMRLLELYDPPR